jgi:hypothetical protein
VQSVAKRRAAAAGKRTLHANPQTIRNIDDTNDETRAAELAKQQASSALSDEAKASAQLKELLTLVRSSFVVRVCFSLDMRVVPRIHVQLVGCRDSIVQVSINDANCVAARRQLGAFDKCKLHHLLFGHIARSQTRQPTKQTTAATTDALHQQLASKKGTKKERERMESTAVRSRERERDTHTHTHTHTHKIARFVYSYRLCALRRRLANGRRQCSRTTMRCLRCRSRFSCDSIR